MRKRSRSWGVDRRHYDGRRRCWGVPYIRSNVKMRDAFALPSTPQCFTRRTQTPPSSCPILPPLSSPTTIMEKICANLGTVSSVIAALGHHHITSETHFAASSKCNVILLLSTPRARSLLVPFLRCPLFFFFDGAFTLAGGAKSNDGNVNGTVSDRSQPFTPNEFPSLFSPAIFPALSPPSSPRARF